MTIYGEVFYFSDLEDKPLVMRKMTLNLFSYLLIICPVTTLSEIETSYEMIDVDGVSYFTLSHVF